MQYIGVLFPEEKRNLLKTVIELRGPPNHWVFYTVSSSGPDFVLKQTGICLKREVQEPQPPGTIATRNAVYTSGDGHCIYRNSEQFFCPQADYISLGKPIRTKDYDLIPVIGTQARRWSNYALIVEKRNGVSVEKIIDGCFNASCEIRAAKVNYRLNDIRFNIGRSDWYLVSAHFRNGRLTVKNSKLDPKDQ